MCLGLGSVLVSGPKLDQCLGSFRHFGVWDSLHFSEKDPPFLLGFKVPGLGGYRGLKQAGKTSPPGSKGM